MTCSGYGFVATAVGCSMHLCTTVSHSYACMHSAEVTVCPQTAAVGYSRTTDQILLQKQRTRYGSYASSHKIVQVFIQLVCLYCVPYIHNCLPVCTGGQNLNIDSHEVYYVTESNLHHKCSSLCIFAMHRTHLACISIESHRAMRKRAR